MQRACNTCLDLISQKKTYSTQFILLTRRPFKNLHQMLPWYLDEFNSVVVRV